MAMRHRGRMVSAVWAGIWPEWYEAGRDAILGTVMRMVGRRRVRARTGTLMICALVFAGGSVNGIAENAGPTPDLAPPFAFGYRTQTSSMVVPCQEIRTGPGTGTQSDPATGRVHAEMAAQAQDCTSLARDASEVWALGAAPEALVGQRAHVTAVFVRDGFDSSSEGSAEAGGGVFLSIGGSQEWVLGSFRCADGTCNLVGSGQDNRMVLEGTIEVMPAQVLAEYRTEAFVKKGTGRSSVSMGGRLESVTFSPAGPDVPGDGGSDLPTP